MSDTTANDEANPVTVGNLMALLQTIDPPNDAVLVVETTVNGQDVELPVMSLAALIGHGRPSKLVIEVDAVD